MIFISYSHRDRPWLDRLQVHLRPLERDNAVATTAWADTGIDAGAKWREKIREAIAAAEVAVLLVSADFLASDFIVTEELPVLLDAADSGALSVLPIVVGPCRFEQTARLSGLQTINDPRKPLVSVSEPEQEAVFVRTSDVVRTALLRPLAQLREELSERFRQADQEQERLLRGMEDAMAQEEADYYRTLSDVGAVSGKMLSVVQLLAAIGPTDAYFARKKAFLESELDVLNRDHGSLQKRLESFDLFGHRSRT